MQYGLRRKPYTLLSSYRTLLYLFIFLVLLLPHCVIASFRTPKFCLNFSASMLVPPFVTENQCLEVVNIFRTR